jgi:hypothetical protein
MGALAAKAKAGSKSASAKRRGGAAAAASHRAGAIMEGSDEDVSDDGGASPADAAAAHHRELHAVDHGPGSNVAQVSSERRIRSPCLVMACPSCPGEWMR